MTANVAQTAGQGHAGSAGVHVGLAELVALELRARGFSLMPTQPVHSLLTGRRASHLRGRGMSFEEIRRYVPGDDVRTIDWKVTARMREPHVRVYTEERDRPGMLVIDQRLSMFFGTRRAMKSVTAAEVAALAIWRLFNQGDRVGAVVFDDFAATEIRPHRSRRQALRILHAIVEKNNALHAAARWPQAPSMLNVSLRAARQLVGHDHVVVVVSDFDGVDEESEQLLRTLARHNDVVVVPIYDPSQVSLPKSGRLVVGNGELQVELDFGQEMVRRGLLASGGRRLDRLARWQNELGVAVLPLSTAEDPVLQLQRLLGGLASPRGVER